MRKVDKPKSSPVDSISDITMRTEQPPAPLEIEICKELDNRKSVTVKRMTEQQMRDLGMQERNCHWNVYHYLSCNKGSGASHVYGWSVWKNDYLLHSVVRYKDGSMECVTPSDEGGPQLDFGQSWVGLTVAGWRSRWCVKLACPRQETPPCPACHPASPRSC